MSIASICEHHKQSGAPRPIMRLGSHPETGMGPQPHADCTNRAGSCDKPCAMRAYEDDSSALRRRASVAQAATTPTHTLAGIGHVVCV